MNRKYKIVTFSTVNIFKAVFANSILSICNENLTLFFNVVVVYFSVFNGKKLKKKARNLQQNFA